MDVALHLQRMNSAVTIAGHYCRHTVLTQVRPALLCLLLESSDQCHRSAWCIDTVDWATGSACICNQ